MKKEGERARQIEKRRRDRRGGKSFHRERKHRICIPYKWYYKMLPKVDNPIKGTTEYLQM